MMRLFGRWVARMRGLFLRDDFDRQLRDELEFHVEMETRRRVADGMDPAAARRAALRDFGGVQKARQQVHQERWGGGVEALARDIRYGVRTLLRSPGYTAVAVATIALAIAADTAVFSVIRGTLLAPLPYEQPERLQRLVTSWDDQPDGNSSPAEYLDLRERLPETTSAVGAYSYGGLTLQEGELAERVAVAVVGAGVLPALGIEPVIGRGFHHDDGLAEDFRLILTDGFWRRLGADPGLVGETIRVSGRDATVLGVLPPGFRMPEELYTNTRVDALLPNEFAPGSVTNRGSHYLNVIVRLRSGVSTEVADAELEALERAMVADHPDAYHEDMDFQLAYQPLHERVAGDVRPALALVGGAVLFILLVACANLAALCLSRYEARHRELSLRAALGAARGRLVTLVLIESLLVAAAGGLLGVALAAIGIDALVAAAPADLPRLDAVHLDGPMLLFGFGLSLLAGAGFGLAPALAAGRQRLQESLRSGGRGLLGGGGERLRRSLVVAQLALAVALLVGAGLLGRSFLALASADPGYRTAGIVTGRVGLPSVAYGTDEERILFFREAVARLDEAPGVEAVGAVTNLPLATGLGDLNFRIEGVDYPPDETAPSADWQVVVPGYFEAMGIELLRGRFLDRADRAGAAGAVVINETFAATWFPEQDPLGQSFVLGGGAGPTPATVVGVVGDVSHSSLGEERRSQMYLAHAQFRHWSSGAPLTSLTFVVRSARPAGDVAELLRSTVGGLDPGVAVHSIASMEQVRSAAVGRERFFAGLVGLFATASLALAAVGVYGVVAYGVAARRQELGVRLALGARSGELVGSVVLGTMRLAAAGLAIGGLIAALGSGVLSSLLFRIEPLDPPTLLAVVGLLAMVAVAGSLLPASRAVRESVGSLLRQD